MSYTSCIVHPAQMKSVIIRQDFIGICEQAPDSHCAAAILNQFVFWTDGKLNNTEQADIENEIQQRGGLAPSQNTELWIWKTATQLKDDLFNVWGANKIGDNLRWLTTMDYLQVRSNPKYGWDQTLQYLVNQDLINDTVQDWSLKLKFPDFKIKVSRGSKLNDGDFKNKATIPYKKTENTSQENVIESIPPDNNDKRLAIKAYEECLGLIVPRHALEIAEYLKEGIDVNWIIDAINAASDQNVRKWVYVVKILENWKTNGRGELPPPNGNGKPPAPDCPLCRNKGFIETPHGMVACNHERITA